MIIGLAGFKRTGKDTFASYFPSNFTRMAFAEPLKQAAAIIYDVPITYQHRHLRPKHLHLSLPLVSISSKSTKEPRR